MQIALVLPCAVLIGWGGGAWLDMRLHQSWITLVGIALGSIAGMVSAIRLALAAVGDPKAGNNSGNDTTGGNSREDS
jgi:F0F1-type ATP synthase assembly protein I